MPSIRPCPLTSPTTSNSSRRVISSFMSSSPCTREFSWRPSSSITCGESDGREGGREGGGKERMRVRGRGDRERKGRQNSLSRLVLVPNANCQSCLLACVTSHMQHRKKCTQTRVPTGTPHVCACTVCPPIRVRGGTTLEVVPPRTQTDGMTARTQTWAAPVEAYTRLHIFLCSRRERVKLMKTAQIFQTEKQLI